MASFEPTTYSDDGSHLKATNFLIAIENVHESSKLFGKDMTSSSTWKDRIAKAGFINVKEDVYKVCFPSQGTGTLPLLTEIKLPQGPWPKDPKLKELGRYHQVNMLEAMPPYTYALFTRMLGWSRVEIEALLAAIRKELCDTSHHLYTKVRIVYGQKPS
jgi:hypothetical protein